MSTPAFARVGSRVSLKEEQAPPSWDGFTKKKVEAKGPFDVIVVGSGISGLSCAAMFARAGKKVLVLERHDRVGGTMHTFQMSHKTETETWKWEFDSGVHYIAHPLRHSRLFHALTKGPDIEWVPMSDDFDCATITKNTITLGPGCAPDAPAPACTAAAAAAEVPEPTTPQFGRRSNRHVELNMMVERFPHYADNLRRFYKQCDKSAVNFGPLVMLLKLLPTWLARALEDQLERSYRQIGKDGSPVSTTDMFQQCGIDPSSDCAGMLTYQWPDFGIPPEEQPFFLYASKVAYHSKGTYYPRGGGNVMSLALAQGVADAGGTIMVRAPVDEILVDTTAKCVRGVRVKGEEVLAPVVVSAAGAYTTLIRMLPVSDQVAELERSSPEFAELRGMLLRGDTRPPGAAAANAGNGEDGSSTSAGEDGKSAASLPLSRTWVSLFVGLDATDAELKIPNRNIFIFPTWDHNSNVRAAAAGGINTEMSAVFITSSSAKDDSWADRSTTNAGAACMNILGVVEWSAFEKYKGKTTGVGTSPVPKELKEEYEELKKSLTARLLHVLYENYPAVRGHVVFTSLGTPLTMNWYIGAVRGEFSGLDHGHSRWTGRVQRLLRPQTPIKGLYLTGQDVTCQSLYYAMVSAVYTVFAVSPLAWLRVSPFVVRDAISNSNPIVVALALVVAALVAVVALGAFALLHMLKSAPECAAT